MKLALTVIRSIGILGAAWILFILVSTHIHIHEQTKDFLPGSVSGISITQKYIMTATLPFGFLAVLLLLPYSRLNKIFRYGCIVLIILLGGYFVTFFFGQYSLSGRFVPGVIPSTILINLTIAIGFFISQILAILLQNKNVEQGTAANRYPPH